MIAATFVLGGLGSAVGALTVIGLERLLPTALALPASLALLCLIGLGLARAWRASGPLRLRAADSEGLRRTWARLAPLVGAVPDPPEPVPCAADVPRRATVRQAPDARRRHGLRARLEDAFAPLPLLLVCLLAPIALSYVVLTVELVRVAGLRGVLGMLAIIAVNPVLWVPAVLVARHRLQRLRLQLRRRRNLTKLRPLQEAVPERDQLAEMLAWQAAWWPLQVAQDTSGSLYRCGGLAVLLVENATPEPDGSHRRYLLRVPPWISRPHEAVAWTFGLRPDQYAPIAES